MHVKGAPPLKLKALKVCADTGLIFDMIAMKQIRSPLLTVSATHVAFDNFFKTMSKMNDFKQCFFVGGKL